MSLRDPSCFELSTVGADTNTGIFNRDVPGIVKRGLSPPVFLGGPFFELPLFPEPIEPGARTGSRDKNRARAVPQSSQNQEYRFPTLRLHLEPLRGRAEF